MFMVEIQVPGVSWLPRLRKGPLLDCFHPPFSEPLKLIDFLGVPHAPNGFRIDDPTLQFL